MLIDQRALKAMSTVLPFSSFVIYLPFFLQFGDLRKDQINVLIHYARHGAPGTRFNQKYVFMGFFFFNASVGSIASISGYFEDSFPWRIF